MKIGRWVVPAVVLSFSPSEATVWTVAPDGSADYDDIQPAIAGAASGDLVLVRPGDYVIRKPLRFPRTRVTVRGELGPEVTTIRMSESPEETEWASVAIFVEGQVETTVLEGFTLTGGGGTQHSVPGGYISAAEGGGIYCSFSSPTIRNCIIAGNRAHTGGGIACWYASPLLEGCEIVTNVATYDGGGVASIEGSVPTFTNCRIRGNSGNDGGGVSGTAVLANCAIEGNSALWSGGGLASGGVRMTDCTVSENQAKWGGGLALIPKGNGGTCEVSRCVISRNAAAENGGGVYCFRVRLANMTDCTLSGNSARSRGGAVYAAVDTRPTLQGCRFTGNTAAHGGGVYGDRKSEVHLTRCTIQGSSGGGVECVAATLDLTSCDIGKNAGESGVQCEEGSVAALTDCTVSGNGGGGVSFLASVTTMANCVVAGNSLFGMYCAESSPALMSCTITGNLGPGVTVRTASPVLRNCIVWGNLSGSLDATEDAVASAFSCCLETAMGTHSQWEGEGNIDRDPCFRNPGSVDDNGTLDDPGDDVWLDGDYRLRCDSPCLDAGSPNGALATDMEGTTRPRGPGVDMGAYEASCRVARPLRVLPAAGDISRVTAVGYRVFFVHGSAVEPRLWVSDGTVSGTVPIGEVEPTSAFVSFRDRVLFTGSHAARGDGLWISDGTEDGTMLLLNVTPGEPVPAPLFGPDLAGRTPFTWTDPERGTELWITDGTPAGTVCVKDVFPGAGSSDIAFGPIFGDCWEDGCWVGPRCLLTANDPVHGRELWSTDGTEDGTVLLKDIVPGPEGSMPSALIRTGSTAFFLARSAGSPRGGPWVTDGTESGTVVYAPSLPTGFQPVEILRIGERLLLPGWNDESGHQELWVTDGTEGGTRMLPVLDPKRGCSSAPAARVDTTWGDGVLGNGLFFFTTSNLAENSTDLWVTDGTDPGTIRLKATYPLAADCVPGWMHAVGTHLFFAVWTSMDACALWVTDGTEQGTRAPGNLSLTLDHASSQDPPISGPRGWAVSFQEQHLFLPGLLSDNGTELCVSDGTVDGTFLVADIVPGREGSDPTSLVAAGSNLFFLASGPGDVHGLWVLPGAGAMPNLRPLFRRGDANADGKLDLSDPIATLGYLFLGAAAFQCFDAADADDSGAVDITDAIFGLAFQFLGGPAPPDPSGVCGTDETADELGCESSPPCDAPW